MSNAVILEEGTVAHAEGGRVELVNHQEAAQRVIVFSGINEPFPGNPYEDYEMPTVNSRGKVSKDKK